MQHFLPLYLAACVLPGIAALTVLSALAARLKNTGLTLYLVAYSSFTVSTLVNLVMFYLGINVSQEISSGIFALIFLKIPFAILMHTTLPLAVNEVTRPPGKRWIGLALILMAAVELVLYCTPLVIRFSRETQTIFFGPVYPFVSALEISLVGYSIAMIILRRKVIENLTVRRYILTIVIVVAVFLPAMVYDQLIFRGVKSINTVPTAAILVPFFYAVLSLATLIFGMRYLTSSSAQVDQSDPQFQVEEKVSLDIILKNLAEEAALSKREMTVIPLIAEGLGNKQIALELHLSTKTVANHIYNIYRKLDVSSRYELIALLK